MAHSMMRSTARERHSDTHTVATEALISAPAMNAEESGRQSNDEESAQTQCMMMHDTFWDDHEEAVLDLSDG
jgi:hypothetical protein